MESGRDRIVGVDMARALALFGMMATHLLPESVDGETVSWWQQVAGGRAAALFALLAGVSLALVTSRAVAAPREDTDGEVVSRRTALRAARWGIVVRAGVIGVLGLLLGGLETGIAVILTYYALLFILSLPFLGMRWQTLVWLSVGFAVLAPVVSHVLRQSLPERSGANPSLEFLLLKPVQLLTELLLTGYYPALPWMTYLLAGLALGRLPLGRIRVAVTLVVTGAVLAAASWGASWWLLHRLGGLERLRATSPDTPPFGDLSIEQGLVRGTFGTTPTSSWWWLTTSAPHSSTPFDLVQTTGSALLVLGLCLLAAHASARVVSTLFAAGTMTLTLYSLHLAALDMGVGPPRGTVELFWWHVAGATAFAVAWRATLGRGPLERFTRACSELARQSVLQLSRPPG